MAVLRDVLVVYEESRRDCEYTPDNEVEVRTYFCMCVASLRRACLVKHRCEAVRVVQRRAQNTCDNERCDRGE